MIHEALFVPADIADKYGGAYEVAHQGVVLRFRDGRAEHIGGICLRHEQNMKDGKWDLTYTVHEDPMPKSGVVVEGTANGSYGYWLVPAAYVSRFEEETRALASTEGRG